LPDLDCSPENAFCQMNESCKAVSKKLKPVGFQLSDYIFEVNQEQYLFSGAEDLCFIVFQKCRLPGKLANLFLIGDVFLRHFYSVYDFDNNQVGLGINIHS